MSRRSQQNCDLIFMLLFCHSISPNPALETPPVFLWTDSPHGIRSRRATLARRLSAYEQLVFHRVLQMSDWSCFVVLSRIQGDSFVANRTNREIAGSSNRNEPFVLTY